MKALVVDDSAYQRLTLASALREHPRIDAVDVAASGEEAIRKVLSSRFDLVTLDIEMPGMDGFAVLRWLMTHRPLPVLIVSDRKHERTAVLALELGAFDVMGKASARSGGLDAWKPLLVEKVEEAAAIRLDVLARRARASPEPAAPAPPRRKRHASLASARRDGEKISALVIAASTGGPPAVRDVLVGFPPRPVVVALAQHIPAPFTRSLAARLATATGWDAREAFDGMELLVGEVAVAPGGRHLELALSGRKPVARVSEEGTRRWCPSADALFASAAETFGPRVVAVVLTGMGDDGALGVRAVADAGGTVICESRESAVISGMPDAAARAVPGARRLPLSEIGPELARLLS
ncbi:MAG TPA: chemotaxis protein CheB [Thermoanaerobaculia bacterium]|nr:chemotaxis protein CheB [Thermoanaerobaculia bacterium]